MERRGRALEIEYDYDCLNEVREFWRSGEMIPIRKKPFFGHLVAFAAVFVCAIAFVILLLFSWSSK